MARRFRKRQKLAHRRISKHKEAKTQKIQESSGMSFAEPSFEVADRIETKTIEANSFGSFSDTTQLQEEQNLTSEAKNLVIEAKALVNLVIDLWRVQKRIEKEGAPEAVKVALERTMERVYGLGFRIETWEGREFDEHLKVEVVEDASNGQMPIIKDCLTPAIFFRNQLVEMARVVLGGKEDDQTNS